MKENKNWVGHVSKANRMAAIVADLSAFVLGEHEPETEVRPLKRARVVVEELGEGKAAERPSGEEARVAAASV